MIQAQYPANEEHRLQALRRYNILDTPPDGNFEHLTQLAAYIFNVPIAIISLVDRDRIWFKSHFGIDAKQIERAPGLCASAILDDSLYVVENAEHDPRTLANPLVTSALGLRFYAAAPLHTVDGFNLGTFCVIDKKPRFFTEGQRKILPVLAKIAMDEMELRLSIRRYADRVQSGVDKCLQSIELDGVKSNTSSIVRLLEELKDEAQSLSPSMAQAEH